MLLRDCCLQHVLHYTRCRVGWDGYGGLQWGGVSVFEAGEGALGAVVCMEWSGVSLSGVGWAGRRLRWGGMGLGEEVGLGGMGF